MAKVSGVVSRILIRQSDRYGRINIVMKLVGDSTIYEGEATPDQRDDDMRRFLLTKPDDMIEFVYDRDFNNYFRDFVNHTFDGEVEIDNQ